MRCAHDFDLWRRTFNLSQDRGVGRRSAGTGTSGVHLHQRCLHAEENAFLQIAKYGGEAIQNGFLFTTASPCELCSKKAYQLGIKKVIYIDPYPGISKDHILSSGSLNPELILFRGALGRAYHRLYQPLLAYKDELKILTGYSVNDGSNVESDTEKHKKLERLEKEVKDLKLSLNITD